MATLSSLQLISLMSIKLGAKLLTFLGFEFMAGAAYATGTICVIL